jgi:signal peptidase
VRLLSRVVIWSIVVALAVGVAGGALAWHDGYRAYAIRTGSMTPTYPTGTLVVDRSTGETVPTLGEVITFRTRDGLVTHRVNFVSKQGFETKGDANRTADVGLVPRQDIVGVVVWRAAYLGYVFVFFQQPTGILSLMLLCFSVWCAWSAFFPTQESSVEQVVALRADEPLPSDEDLVVLPGGERAAAAQGGSVTRIPEVLAGAAASGRAVIRLPEQRCRPDLLST